MMELPFHSLKSLSEDDEMENDKDEQFVREPLDTKYLPRVEFPLRVINSIEFFSGRSNS